MPRSRPGRISIARWAPRKHPAGYRLYRPLNPLREHMRLPSEAFDLVYAAQLAALVSVAAALDAIAAFSTPHAPSRPCDA